MKLSDYSKDKYLKLLVYGDSGAGKTCLAAGFPTPIIYLDFDGKVGSAASYYAEDNERLSQIEVIPLAQQLDRDPIESLVQIINQLREMQASGNYQYKTLVLDSITTFSSATLMHIVRSNKSIKRVTTKQGDQPGMQDYGILKREFQRLIPGLLSLKMNVVMLGHVDIIKDENTGEILRGVKMDGSFAAELPIYFEEVWHQFVTVKDGKPVHVLQTRSDGKHKCRTQIKEIPGLIPASFETVEKYI